MKITADRDDARRLAGLEPLRAAPQIDPGRVAAALDATAGGFRRPGPAMPGSAAPSPDGEGLARAVRAALDDAGPAPGDSGQANAHGTSTVLNDTAEAAAPHVVFRRPPPVTADKSVTGHPVGAAGASEAAPTVQTLRHGVVPPTANLDRTDGAIRLGVVTEVPRQVPGLRTAVSVSSGFGGRNAAVVLTAV